MGHKFSRPLHSAHIASAIHILYIHSRTPSIMLLLWNYSFLSTQQTTFLSCGGAKTHWSNKIKCNWRICAGREPPSHSSLTAKAFPSSQKKQNHIIRTHIDDIDDKIEYYWTPHTLVICPYYKTQVLLKIALNNIRTRYGAIFVRNAMSLGYDGLFGG